MRGFYFLSFLLLLCLLLSSMFTSTAPVTASGQFLNPNQPTQAKDNVIAAFEAIQAAVRMGASNQSLAPMIAELNEAIAYEVIADQGSGNSTAALQSISLSNDVIVRAQTLGNEAQARSQERSIVTYLLAVGLAFASSLAILKVERIRRFLEKRRLLKSRIEPRGTKHVG